MMTRKVVAILGCCVWRGAKYQLRHLLHPIFTTVGKACCQSNAM